MNPRGYTSDEIVQLPSGLKLETSLSSPRLETSSTTTDNKLAICLHPWSWLGGRMYDPVLGELRKPLLARGYHVLRYNSRGVGKSSGWPSVTGIQEAKDLQELVHWALQKIPSVSSLVILGYSHGSLIASLFPLLEDTPGLKISHILLSYPLGPRSWLTAFRGGHYTTTLANLLRDSRSHVLAIYGDNDDFTGVESYDTWADSLRREAVDGGNLEILKIEHANHFWRDDDARETLLQHVQQWVP
ncbi:alpha/beta-hydrolase [Trametopsis cervina]|nr:alpha/beta-hydrolase [Trametopsis cervina]